MLGNSLPQHTQSYSPLLPSHPVQGIGQDPTPEQG